MIHQKFFVRWKNEYLASLSKNNKRTDNKEIKEGSVVLLLNERKTRDAWPLARILQVFKSSDDVVRSVELLLPINLNETKKSSKTKKRANKNALSSDNKSRITTRGVENICVLEEASVDQQQLEDAEVAKRFSNTDFDSDGLAKIP